MTTQQLSQLNILVTGGNGFLGSHVIEELLDAGAQPQRIFSPSASQFDFRKESDCKQAVANKDIVIHLAAVVGGIGFNQKYPGTLFYDNALMGLLLMETARQARVKKFVSIGTVCSYPKFTLVPFVESDLWNGYPEETNAAYGLAKKMLLVQGQAYRKQFGFHSIHLIPVNLYGPGDNFDPKSSHVIPALIRKIHTAKQKKSDTVTLWGTGTATREFLYVKDAAKAITLATLLYDDLDPINLGSTEEICIADLAKIIAQYLDYSGKIRFDRSKPDGQPRRKLDTQKAFQQFRFQSSTPFRLGLRKTIDWFLAQKKRLHETP